MRSLKLRRLKQELSNKNRIIIYGAGSVAKKTCRKLMKIEIGIEYCVVTKKVDSCTYLENLFIYNLEEKIDDIKNSSSIIVVAVSEIYNKEIEHILRENGIFNYIFIMDYVRNFVNVQYKKDFSYDYLEEIAEWYVDENIPDILDITAVKNKLEKDIQKRNNKREITFVVGHMAPRVIKMVRALHNNGYSINLLFCVDVTGENPIYEELKTIANYCICECIEELMYQIIMLNSQIVHIFSNYNNLMTSIANFIIHAKSIFPSIVFEQYDIANGMYWSVPEKTLEEERYCIENCDGLCCRGNEIDYLKEERGVKIQGRVIKFFDYIGDKMYDSINRDHLSLCCAGYFVTEEEWPDATYSCWLEFARLCEKNECHLHMYPPVWDDKRFENYIQMDKQSVFFHFHKPVAYRKLTEELSQYDYGVVLSKKGFLDMETNGTFTNNKMIYCATNKVYDNLEAGLPIIAPFPVKVVEYLEKKGVLLNWTIEEFDFKQLRKRKEELKKRVQEVRCELQMKNRIKDLIRFYDSL